MNSHNRYCLLRLLVSILFAVLSAGTSPAQSAPPAKYPDFPSETPSEFKPATSSFEYEKRDVMIPIRDGVRLHTVIIVPRGAKGAPILLHPLRRQFDDES